MCLCVYVRVCAFVHVYAQLVRNSTIMWQKPCVNYSNCVVPKSTIWLRRRRRPMSGLEKLCLHGLPLSAINESLVSNENANKWAGNSFQGFSMALAIVALLSSVEMHWS